MLHFDLETINRIFFLSLQPLNIRRYLVCCFFASKYVISGFFFFAFSVAIQRMAPTFSPFKLEKYHLCFPFSFETTVNLFLLLILGFLNAKYIHFRWLFVERVQKGNCCLCKRFSLNMFLSPFCGILTRKCINHRYLVTVYTLNKPSTS